MRAGLLQLTESQKGALGAGQGAPGAAPPIAPLGASLMGPLGV